MKRSHEGKVIGRRRKEEEEGRRKKGGGGRIWGRKERLTGMKGMVQKMNGSR